MINSSNYRLRLKYKVSAAKSEVTMQWAIDWLDSVADDSNTMSQRKLSSIEKRGGLNAVKSLAKERGVHLLKIEDDKGNELIAASRKPFQVIC